MEHFYQNLGEAWFTYPTLYSEMVNYFPENSHFVEVGTWKGMSAAYMAVEIINSGKNIKFDCVDIWEYVKNLQNDIDKNLYTNLYNIFLNNISPVKHIINPIKALSSDAANQYADESLDFVFIDAAHDYKSVKNDITAWYPKIKKTGIIAGHDCYMTTVSRAVNEFFHNKEVILREKDQCWLVYKSKTI
jgi:predicted O-methyltransferase YrrM